jgi:hypothetical protein
MSNVGALTRSSASPCEVRAPASRDDRAHDLLSVRGCVDRSGSARAGAEVTDLETVRGRLVDDPVRDGREPVGHQLDVEAIAAVQAVALFFVFGEEIEQQCAEAGLLEQRRHVLVTRAEAAAAAAMREQHDPLRAGWNLQLPLQGHVADRYLDLTLHRPIRADRPLTMDYFTGRAIHDATHCRVSCASVKRVCRVFRRLPIFSRRLQLATSARACGKSPSIGPRARCRDLASRFEPVIS